MIHSSTAKSQTLLTASSNKVLAQVLQEIAPKDFAKLSIAKDLTTILSTIFKEASGNDVQNQKLLDILKNNPTFKDLANVNTTIKDLLSTLQNQKQNFPIQTQLENMMEHIKNINDKTLKTKLENSGVFLESKLKNFNPQESKIQDLLSNDFKAALLKTKTELEGTNLPNKQQVLNIVDKLSMQIDYYQLASHLSNGSAIYLPYEFDALEDGSLAFKKDKNDAFFCDIDLSLKEYGELGLRLGLFEKKYLSINITAPNKKLREVLQNGLGELKEQLTTTGLLVKDIRFLDLAKNQYAQENSNIELGFEVKI